MKLPCPVRQIISDIRLLKRTVIKIALLKRKNSFIRVHTFKSLTGAIKKRNDVCHVIGTGASALDAYKNNIVKHGDYIIGVNFAAFLPYHFDLYFFEETITGRMYMYRRTKYFLTLLNRRRENMPNLVLKNIYASTVPFLTKYLAGAPYSIVLDRQILGANINRVIKILVRKPGLISPNYGSSVVLACAVAYHGGFKNIVMHGVDFAGPHIYHDPDLQRETGVRPPSPYVPAEVKHPASGQEPLWRPLARAFQERGVTLFCASSQSKLSAYIDVYPG